MPECAVARLGVVPYQQAWDIQRRIHMEVASGERNDTLLLLEHPHVYTLGRRGQDSDILVDEARLAEIGAEVHHVDRGGEVTYHGPGQLVGYPILNLRRMGGGPLKYVRTLEQTLIATLFEFAIEADSEDRPTGVWIGESKIAAIGVKVSRGVTTHGFALNVDPDLSYLDHIIACGMPEVAATSVSKELGHRVSVDDVISAFVPRFSETFGLDVAWNAPTSITSGVVDTPLPG
ncbi:MAG: lipoyl(octanoyl) transferase LipB [SAR202 cluster bacterium]|jgi:lipoate-protein ligase B|nr:lipoyl(octanoyl) transferase LipB [SAR202 cluster bacterium]MDP6511890.1 lipoyl(octanoyl) transferase LipB [SAR202 cluster bacterium]MDP6713519.1 lipoyl(octanoyl) transferase LipB [SAR202 cluster bacterium]